ncbi:heterokaryon incompatibility domain-containing protein [Trichoderma ceciliae]
MAFQKILSYQCNGLFEHAANLLASESEDGNISDDVAAEFTADHHSMLTANSNAQSCHMCSLIAHVFPHILDSYDPDCPRQWVMWGDKAEQFVDLGLHIPKQDFIQDLRIQRAKAAVSLQNSSSTWSFEGLQTVQIWMQNCTALRTTHNQCARPQIKRQLPLRLVDVMPDQPLHTHVGSAITQDEFQSLDIDAPPPARIVSTSSSSIPLDIRYMTLSHRWGNSPSIILNSKTAPALLSGNIPLELLNSSNAKLFRHAIYVTRCLGIRYLWIDSMCIMQDDDSEKGKEIALMCEIYFNSSLNISATDSTSGADGLIFQRDALKTTPCRVSLDVSGETLDLVAFHNKAAVESDEGELNTRGWVLQERILSPRVLHFTKHQIFWECNSLLASEIRPRGEPIDPADFTDMRGILSSSYPKVLPDDTMKALWYGAVRHYSATSLSFPGDRLLAVSALAERFSVVSGQSPDDYVAGIWLSHLPLALVWRRIPERRISPNPRQKITAQERIAPTWSWAALTCAVELADMDDLHANVQVLDVSIQRRSTNLFDGVTSCRLRIRGRMCKVERHLENAGLEIAWDTPPVRDADEAPELFLLHVAYRPFKSRRDMRGLVLQRTKDKGQYTRAGAFSTSNFDIEGTYMQEAFAGSRRNLAENDFLELHKGEGYTVEII